MTDIATVRELLRRAILTHDALPNAKPRFLYDLRSAWPPYVRKASDAYNAAPLIARMFQPTPVDHSRMLKVLGWLDWYKRECPKRGPETVRLFKAWAREKPKWWLQERCTTEWGRATKCRKTCDNRLKEMYRTIAIVFKEDLFCYRIDGFPEFYDIGHNHSYVGNRVESDLNDLPTSPKACISATSEPLSPRDEARAHKLLNKRLERNRLSAMQRKRTKPAAQTLMAAVRC